MFSGARTRAQKRRIGEIDSLLWDVIVDNDDICFKHIIPRLNLTDIKFLHDVNSETRALIQRWPYVDELKSKFRVEEMSSISTLEFAWNNIQWGAQNRYTVPMDQAWFCSRVAETNKLELLKWAREEKGCEWNERTISAAAGHGNIEMIKYCLANKCPINYFACAYAAGEGHLECLKYLREEVKAPWNTLTALSAAESGHLHIFEYLVERKFDEYHKVACHFAAKYGQLDCLKYLHETAKAPWNYWAVREAHKNNHSECVQYLLDNNCPLPKGWSYANGELHVPDNSEPDFSESDGELHVPDNSESDNSESELDLSE